MVINAMDGGNKKIKEIKCCFQHPSPAFNGAGSMYTTLQSLKVVDKEMQPNC